MTLSFLFPTNDALAQVRTGLLLDARGAKLTVVGIVPTSCCGPMKVVVQYVVKGRANEDPTRLTLVERMIRGSVPDSYQNAWSAAEDLTELLVEDYLKNKHQCKGALSGEAA